MIDLAKMRTRVLDVPADHMFVDVRKDEMLALLDLVGSSLREVERLQADEAVMLLSRRIGLGEPVRPDVHARVSNKLAAMTAARDELGAIAAKREYPERPPEFDVSLERIAELRKVGA